MSFHNRKIGFVGAGAMAEALLKGMLTSGLFVRGDILAADVNPARLQYLTEKYGIKTVPENKDVIRDSDIVVLAVKPAVIPSLLNETGPLARAGQLFISVAAGISTGLIESYFPLPVPVIRVMPNTPCLVGAGASAYTPGSNAGEEHARLAEILLSAAGIAVQVPEHMMDAVTGLSGSGPAYVFTIIEALADAGVRAGLTRDTAVKLAAQTLMGAAKMVQETGEHPARLRDMVTTPGGTTIAGLHVLETGRLRATLMDAVMAAASRSRELGAVK